MKIILLSFANWLSKPRIYSMKEWKNFVEVFKNLGR